MGVIRTRYYDRNGEPVSIKNGYAVLEVYNNEAGKKVGEAYYDADLNPAYKRKKPFVRYLVETDKEGMTVRNYYNALNEIVKTEEVK